MAEIIFYEKPGCINNAKQKQLLKQSGHQLIAKDLLTEEWSAKRLRPFFADKPISEWFNSAAPRIKQGEVEPEKMDQQQALQAMCEDPLLIRRPLMQVGEECRVGFDVSWVNQWIGLKVAGPSEDLENCPRSHQEESCK